MVFLCKLGFSPRHVVAWYELRELSAGSDDSGGAGGFSAPSPSEAAAAEAAAREDAARLPEARSAAAAAAEARLARQGAGGGAHLGSSRARTEGAVSP